MSLILFLLQLNEHMLKKYVKKQQQQLVKKLVGTGGVELISHTLVNKIT